MATRRKYRSQAGIVLDILETLISEGPMRATRLATYANLPYDRLKVVLESLVAKGHVRFDEETRTYSITKEGERALQTLRETRKILEALGFKL